MAWGYAPFGFYKKKKENPYSVYTPPKYEGERPYTGADVGYGADTLKSLSGAYLPELMRKAQGEGLVGLGSSYIDTASNRLQKTLGESREDALRRASAQASGQGLRGGIPLELTRQVNEDYADALNQGLTDIELQDLMARREDINKAFYQLPEEVSRGSGIQQNRSAFDFGVYQAEQPTLLENPKEQSILPAILSLAGTAAGAYYGGPQGAAVGAQLGSGLGNSLSGTYGGNKSFSSGYNKLGFNDNSLANAYSNYLALQRRA